MESIAYYPCAYSRWLEELVKWSIFLASILAELARAPALDQGLLERPDEACSCG
jgi:hypothetical protein